MKKIIILMAILAASLDVSAGCLDNLQTTTNIVSKIRGFYINADKATGETKQVVILDKATCVASQSGDVTLASTTKSHYYLGFDDNDKTLFAMLLSAESRGIRLSFRLSPSENLGNTNKIAYVLSPSNVNSQ